MSMGDPLAEVATKLLVEGTPFPGDDLANQDTYDLGRFSVYRVSKHEHAIVDHLRWLDDDVMVPSSYLMDTKFCLADWYSDQKGPIGGYQLHECEEFHTSVPMGDAIGDRVEEILDMGRPYERDVILDREPRESRFDNNVTS
ncbi:hypothetical protein SERLA73DRAFT_125667 [Serpula lacrymans var. lacrymans S7.3]|uniref:Uncharacterized protein n=1 Tax=Serpula lacrymans var. lacrymans (strain S7.3) TaxID=936435 RepID=F8QAH6_SERL3|nr:hypothetical protein SERLA73DRAFT_125667 [Serpula lacrymans var. lacrymans S7.3]